MMTITVPQWVANAWMILMVINFIADSVIFVQKRKLTKMSRKMDRAITLMMEDLEFQLKRADKAPKKDTPQ